MSQIPLSRETTCRAHKLTVVVIRHDISRHHQKSLIRIVDEEGLRFDDPAQGFQRIRFTQAFA